MTRLALLGPLHGPIAVAVGAAVGAAIGAALSVWLLRRPTPAARPDTRAPMRLAGVWLAIASAVGIGLFAANRRDSWTIGEFLALARVPVMLSLVGCAIVFAIAVLDGFAENELAHFDSGTQHDAGASWWLTHVGAPRPSARVADVERARGLLAASRRSRIAVVVVVLAAAATLLVYARFAAE